MSQSTERYTTTSGGLISHIDTRSAPFEKVCSKTTESTEIFHAYDIFARFSALGNISWTLGLLYCTTFLERLRVELTKL